MTYTERSKELALDSSIAVLVLSDSDCRDIELMMFKPRMLPEAELEYLEAVWNSRNLRSIGVIALVGSTPKCALREPLEPGKVSRLADAFLAYLQGLFSDSFAEHLAAVELNELDRMASLEDPRPEGGL